MGLVWTIVVAGGSGRRFGSMKQFARLGDMRVLDHAVLVARANSDGVVVVVPADDVDDELGQPSIQGLGTEVHVTAGGPTRTASVRLGLALVPEQAAVILVHDAARPFATSELFQAVISAVIAGVDGAVPGLPVSDTVKTIEVVHVTALGAVAPKVISTPDRATLVAVQTPQAFRADILRQAFLSEIDSTDDSSLVEAIGGTVIIVPGQADNRKITQPEDLLWARQYLTAQLGEQS